MDKKPTKNELLESLEKDILTLKNTDDFGNYILTQKQFNFFSNCVANNELKIKEKDQRIAELEKQNKEVRKQVCDYIFEYIENIKYTNTNKKIFEVDKSFLSFLKKDVLYQIEKGENNE